MRILVTGAGGHVGGAVLQRLYAEGHSLIALGRNPLPSLSPEIEMLHVDITSPDAAEHVLQKASPLDGVVHCAACQTGDAEALMKTNYFGTKQLLEAARKAGASRFIYLGSMSYLRRPLELPVTEVHPLDMADPYAASKYLGEWIVLQEEKELKGISLRISSPVGAGIKYRRIFRAFVEKALRNEDILLHGQGGRRQDYVDVRDVAEAVQLALTKDTGRGAALFNIASGRALPNLALAERCIAVLNSGSEIRFSGEEDPDENMAWQISIDRAEAQLNYVPRFSIDDSILALAGELEQA